MNNKQLILFLLDNSGSMNAGFGAVAEVADKAVDAASRFLGGSLGSFVGGVAREAAHRIVSKVNVLNVAFNGTLIYLNKCRNTIEDECVIGTVRYGSRIKELFPPTGVSELSKKTGADWFSADLGMTNTVDAFSWAAEHIQDYLYHNPDSPKPWIIHITDGMWNEGGDPTSVACELMKSCLVFNALIEDDSILKVSRSEFNGYSNPADVQLHLASNLVEISSRIPQEWVEAVRKVFPNLQVESRLFFPAGTEDLLKGLFDVVQELYSHLYAKK